LDTGLKLGERGVPCDLGRHQGQLGGVDLRLGSRADLLQGFQVVDVFLIEGDLLIKQGGLILVALYGGGIADIGSLIRGECAGKVQRAEADVATKTDASRSEVTFPETLFSEEMVSEVTVSTWTAVPAGTDAPASGLGWLSSLPQAVRNRASRPASSRETMGF